MPPVASWCLGALPPVHLRAVCFVRAMVVVVLYCHGVPREQIMGIMLEDLQCVLSRHSPGQSKGTILALPTGNMWAISNNAKILACRQL